MESNGGEPDALSRSEVDAIIGAPGDLVAQKIRPVIDEHFRTFIALSPFLALGTVDAGGNADVSPRGDPPGSVKVVDATTLVLPERPGNKLVDSVSNILETGSVALLFLIPGFQEMLRVNGRGTIINDASLLAGMEVKGKPPLLGIRVAVEEAFIHCSKAVRRSQLWDPDSLVDRGELPSLGQILRDQIEVPDLSAEDIDELADNDARTRLY